VRNVKIYFAQLLTASTQNVLGLSFDAREIPVAGLALGGTD
jgi:hypothetical protein